MHSLLNYLTKKAMHYASIFSMFFIFFTSMVTSKKVQGSEVGNRRREVMEEKGYYFTIPVNNSPKNGGPTLGEISKFQKVRRILKCVF